ncbi:ABC transporter permease, partial [Desulfosporosinus sp. OT]|uniref:ABC transporter permease n=1 Tax=Desulfosporosinus sp. OT TaxID=913865 RepID=UPI000223AE3D
EEYTGPNAKLIAVAKVQGRSNGEEKVGRIKDLFKSSSLDFTIAPETNSELKTEHGQNVSITVVNTVPPDTPAVTGMSMLRPYAIMGMAPYSLKEKLVHSETAANIRVKGMTFQSKNPSQFVAEMKMMIQGEGITASYLLLNSSEIFDQNRNMIFIANVFAYTFIIMISLIAVANVFNTISTNIKLRRRELAMLRSVGMSDHNFNKMMRFECAFYGLRALLVGLPTAIIFSWLIYKGMFIGGAEGINFVLPWASIGITQDVMNPLVDMEGRRMRYIETFNLRFIYHCLQNK